MRNTNRRKGKRHHLPYFGQKSKHVGLTRISREEYNELREYANSYNIKISGFKKFTGDISTIKEVIDDIVEIGKDFPEILQGRKTIELELDSILSEEDFATTFGHVISLNANLYSDISYLTAEYDLAVEQGKFVKGTNYRSVIRHEVGHVVANIYRFNSMKIAKAIIGTKSNVEVLEYAKRNLSFYSVECADGTEIISECFSGFYSGTENVFAKNFVQECIKRKGATYDKK